MQTRSITLHLTRLCENDSLAVPRHRMWLTKCFNSVLLKIDKSIDLAQFVKIIKQFRSDVKLTLHFFNFTDEQAQADKFVELLSYYKIEELFMDQCELKLRASC